MRKLLFCSIIISSLFSCREEPPVATNLDSQIERIAKSAIITGATPGISIGIIKNGVSKTYHFGVQNLSTGAPFDDYTICEIGSITKPFTAYLAAQLVLQNQLNLQAPANEYLPPTLHLPTRGGKSVTVLQLLNHTSGLPGNPDNLSPNPHREPQPFNYPESRMAAYLRDVKLMFTPGDDWAYSNIGMGLAGIAIREASGRPISELYATQIFQPLGMRHTFTCNSDAPPSNVAQGYMGRQPFGLFIMSEVFAAAGIIKSNIHDMLLFLDWAIETNDAALQSTQQQTVMIEEGDFPVGNFIYYDLGMGLGWGILRNPNHENIYNHSGGTYGFSSFIAFNTAQKTGIIILCNAAFTVDLSIYGLEILQLLDS